jgi:hypothetical protein
MAVSGTVLALISGFSDVRDIYYIRSTIAVNSKLNYKYLKITLNGPKEQIIRELSMKARMTKYCDYCGTELVYKQRSSRPGDTASLDRVYGATHINSSDLSWICDRDNWSKNYNQPGEYIQHCFRVTEHIVGEARRNNMTVDEFVKWKWPGPRPLV